MKTCSICCLEQELEKFRIRNKKTGLRRNECNQCLREKHKKWRDENPGKNREYYDKSYEKNRKRYCKYCGERYRQAGTVKFCSLKCYILGSVKKSENECWEFQGALNIAGYGKTKIEGKHFSVHRLSYMIFKGNIPEAMFVCHICDNRKCCNPDHLWIGTPQQNTLDMIKKGRAVIFGNKIKGKV